MGELATLCPWFEFQWQLGRWHEKRSELSLKFSVWNSQCGNKKKFCRLFIFTWNVKLTILTLLIYQNWFHVKIEVTEKFLIFYTVEFETFFLTNPNTGSKVYYFDKNSTVSHLWSNKKIPPLILSRASNSSRNSWASNIEY